MNIGSAIDARMPITMTTTSSSMKVKPASSEWTRPRSFRSMSFSLGTKKVSVPKERPCCGFLSPLLHLQRHAHLRLVNRADDLVGPLAGQALREVAGAHRPRVE